MARSLQRRCRRLHAVHLARIYCSHVSSSKGLLIIRLPRLLPKYWYPHPGSVREECRVHIEFSRAFLENLPSRVQLPRKRPIAGLCMRCVTKSPVDWEHLAPQRVHHSWIGDFFDPFCRFLVRMKNAQLKSRPVQTPEDCPAARRPSVREMSLPCRRL